MSKKILTREEVLHLSKLANLKLSDLEIKKYQSQLNETLDYVANLSEINTDHVSPHFYPTSANNVYFEDQINTKRMLKKEEALKNAKKKKDSFFVVKRIL